MTIDAGSTIGFNAAFPVPGIKQSSKAFRDNFAIIRTAIDRLNVASSSTNSVLTLQTAQAIDGQITYTLGYPDHVLTLPSEATEPATLVKGMVRFRGGFIQVCDGLTWANVRPMTAAAIADALGYVPAPSTSPAFGGIPTAPTAALGTRTAQIANTEFVGLELNRLLDGAPGAIDTLGEIAHALGNDPDLAAHLTAQLAAKASIDHTHNQYVANIITANGTHTGNDLTIVGQSGIVLSATNGRLTIAINPSAASHGALGGDNLHALAVAGGAAGFMSGADKAKLDTFGGNGYGYSRFIVQNGSGLNIRDAASPNETFIFTQGEGIALDTSGLDMTVSVNLTDTAHGMRGGSALHALAIPNGTAGFLSGADKFKLDQLTTNNATTTTSGYLSPADKQKIDVFSTQRFIGDAFSTINTITGSFLANGGDTLRIEGLNGIVVTAFEGVEKTLFLSLDSVGNNPVSDVMTSLDNFNTRNDRNGNPIDPPVIAGDGTAIDHTLSTDSSVNISFEWTWDGGNDSIDGFLIYVHQDTAATPYVFLSNVTTEQVFEITADKRSFIMYGMPADQYYTFYVQAYRVVDPDIDPTRVIKSPAVKSSAAGEDPYRPEDHVAFDGNVIGTVAGTAAATVRDNAVNAWGKFTGVGNTLPAGNVEFNFAASGSKGGNASNVDNIGSLTASTVQGSVLNFNDRNDRDGSAIIAPVVLTDQTAVDHTINTDGSANISFEWTWSGLASDIDGFIVTVYQSSSSAAYTIGTNTAAEQSEYVTPEKRAFIMYGVPANQYYTFYVQAYRIVDPDVNAAGVIRSIAVKSVLGSENPYLPTDHVQYLGDVTGTVAGTAASVVVSNAANAWAKFSGTGNTLPSGNVEFNFAASGSKGGDAYNAVNLNNYTGSTIVNATINFNTRNDRNGAAIADPVVPSDGTAVDHSANTDGSVNISFEWTWGGSNADIDGFIVTVVVRGDGSPYSYGSNTALESVYYITPEKRAFIDYGVPANQYYTFFVQAYRIVDADINSNGVIRSNPVKSNLGEENPYRPAVTPAFQGDVTGTIAGTSASTLAGNVNSLLGRVTTIEQTTGNSAYWQLDVAAGSGAAAFISARAKNGDGTTTTNVSIGAREFQIYNGTTGNWSKIFEVVNGQVNVYGTLQANTIYANMIVAGEVKTPNLATNSVTFMDQLYNSSNLIGRGYNNFQDSIGYNFTLNYDAHVIVLATGRQSYSSKADAWAFNVYVDDYTFLTGAAGKTAVTDSVAVSGGIYLPAGAHNIRVSWAAANSTISLPNASLVVLGTYR